MSFELSLDMQQQLFEVFRIVDNKAVYDRLVDLDRRELILVVFVDDSRELGKVFAYLGCAVADYQVKLVKHLFEELVVAFDVL